MILQNVATGKSPRTLAAMLLFFTASTMIISDYVVADFLTNGNFTADDWMSEETFIQNSGMNTGLITGWATEGLVRGYNLDVDGDGDPTMNSGGQTRIWGGWQPGDGLRQVGFQSFSDPENALSQDASTFVAGVLYTFSVQTGPGFEGANQAAFIQIRRASDNTLLSESLFDVILDGNTEAATQSVSYLATIADSGSAIRVRFGTSGGSGTAVFSNASLTSNAIPEPTLSLALAFLGGIVISRRQRHIEVDCTSKLS